MLDSKQVLDAYFPEVRAWLIQIAAVMDRHDRAGRGQPQNDERLTLYRKSLEVLLKPGSRTDRAETIQRLFSDPV